MEKIIEIYNRKCDEKNDINEHLPTFKKYTEGCDTVVEMGVRSVVSTWGFLAGKPKKLISIDILHPNFWNSNDLDYVIQYSKENNIDFEFIQADVLNIEIPECDILFLDTIHKYEQVKNELKLHSSKVKKYIIFHDTESYRVNGENGGVGIWPAIEEFLNSNVEWSIHEIFTNNNGLTIIKRN
jgi:hypothetical protein